MIIDTTCSVIERKMKEVPKKSELTFGVSDFTVNMDTITISTGTTNSIPVIFDGEVNFNGNVIFNKCVTFNGGVAGNIHWTNSVPKSVSNAVSDYTSTPVHMNQDGTETTHGTLGGSTPVHMNQDGTETTHGSLGGLENDDHFQYSLSFSS